jgi:hypothetical protein
LTEHAKPGRDIDRARPQAPPPPPRWSRWLPFVGLIITALILLWPMGTDRVQPVVIDDVSRRP